MLHVDLARVLDQGLDVMIAAAIPGCEINSPNKLSQIGKMTE
jgi:hypothetical protein